MVAEKEINEFVSRLRVAAGANLQSVILYGSAADGEFHPDFSNVNLLCILRESSFAALTAIASAVEWWTKKKHHAPLVLTGEELQRSTDVFSIELLDMQQRHRLLYGDDLLSGLHIPLHLHRAQLEYELREKLILLRGRLLAAPNNKETFVGVDAGFVINLYNLVSPRVDCFRRSSAQAQAGSNSGAGQAHSVRSIRVPVTARHSRAQS